MRAFLIAMIKYEEIRDPDFHWDAEKVMLIFSQVYIE